MVFLCFFNSSCNIQVISIGHIPKGYMLSGTSYFAVNLKEKLPDKTESFILTIEKNTFANIDPVIFNFKKEMVLNKNYVKKTYKHPKSHGRGGSSLLWSP